MFFIGGYDAEMVAIREVLQSQGIKFVDNRLGWGAKTSDYADEINEALSSGREVVTIELINDLGLQGLTEVDHHNERSNEPASLLQVLSILGLEPTRQQLLIAANDSGYIPAMEAMGASIEEVRTVRALDRAAQGITPDMEAEAERAIAAAVVKFGVTIVHMAHSKSATVTDRLYNPSVSQNILILSEDGEINYFGNGALCSQLHSAFQGWCGGSGLGKEGGNAFWGGYANQAVVEEYIVDTMRSTAILNLTQHAATSDQVAVGVFKPADKREVQALLTFNEIPSTEEIKERAEKLADIVRKEGYASAMIGGAPYLMGALEAELKKRNVTPLYSFTKRESVETVNEKGEVVKTAVFRHVGWVKA